ncbi:MAG: hypothetical protein UY92_C0014G0010 [Candidatus Magasanikbacteria bacterium GW2011_GWA2_56_11]|uniref:DUF8128 domain-containing protein n=1 Tax=Candidatus Magasanikbacteria bacterium GW2011_GWA2_56_11 TaxID=1619044 RepID=A0A0G1YET5_9BACT|nr:MAG: hypothetical protein UY92_C0014G0010 [Candidatus Magasanikbacteria bacterium GW2011_GWA2_56_11]
MDIGIFFLDFNRLADFFGQGALPIIGQVLAVGGWLVLAYLLFFAGFHLYEDLKQDLNTHEWKFILLAVDVPPLNVQTPKAVEQMFSHIAGAFSKPDLKDRLKDGYKQRWFSFEIISIEGYIQFLVWTEEAFRDLVEAAVYAQYPDAEITEVEDYTGGIPDSYPSATHDIWISDFGLAENSAYPIRSYREFEHAISKDTVLKDPMGTFLESFTRIGPGEQMWFQILLEPISNDWKEDAIKKIKEVIGEKSHPHLNLIDHTVSGLQKMLEGIGDQVFGRESVSGHDEDHSPPNQLQYLTPGMSKLVEAMEAKIGKLGFKTKIRGLYGARKEVFNPLRGVNALVGALTQYNIPSANSIVPTFAGKGSSKKSSRKKSLLMKAYKKRKIGAGGKPFVLNIEELATIWHFPMSHVKTPLVQKAASKQAEPPVGLPVERLLPALSAEEADAAAAAATVEAGKHKRFSTDSGEVIEYDDLF